MNRRTLSDFRAAIRHMVGHLDELGSAQTYAQRKGRQPSYPGSRAKAQRLRGFAAALLGEEYQELKPNPKGPGKLRQPASAAYRAGEAAAEQLGLTGAFDREAERDGAGAGSMWEGGAR